MPTWGDILNEIHQSARQNNGQPDFDSIRRRYLVQLNTYTQRSLIIYYSDWLSGGNQGSAITLEDMQAFMEVNKDLPGPALDILLHTPGGSAEATHSVVSYLRQKYTDIRIFVPLAAMSAGTMFALAADRIVMGKHSQLGPIDPQLFVNGRFVPARAIVEQFEQAKQEAAADPASLSAWYPILQQYGPGLIAQCSDAEELSKRLVKEWLERYMFAGDQQADTKAQAIADYFGAYSLHRSHSLGIFRDNARNQGLKVDDLEADQVLQDLVLSVHHATMHTLAGPAVKIVENNLGRAYVRMAQQIAVPQMIPGMPFPTP